MVLLFLFALALAFLTTWAVAWTCGVYSRPDYSRGRSWQDPIQLRPPWRSTNRREVQLTYGFGVEYLRVTLQRWREVDITPDWLGSGGHVPKWSRTYESWSAGEPRPAATREEPPASSFAYAEPDEPPLLTSTWSEACYGWPFPCLNCSWPRAEKVRDAYIPPYWLRQTSQRGRYAAFPSRPYWPAVILNIGFYTLLWLPLLFLPRVVRRALRRYRGRCAMCGYDIQRGKTERCPECGWKRALPATNKRQRRRIVAARRPRPRRRRLLVLGLCTIGLGFVTSWAVAWGRMAWLPVKVTEWRRATHEGAAGEGALTVTRLTIPAGGATSESFGLILPGDMALPERTDIQCAQEAPRWTRTRRAWESGRLMPAAVWSDYETDPSALVLIRSDPPELHWSERGSGWPLTCLRALSTWSTRRGFLGVDVPDRGDCLPWHPWWPGLAGNTALYALAWFVALIPLSPGADALRRHWRRRCGECPACKCDLRGDLDAGCPECGWGRQSRTPDDSEPAPAATISP
ncbi:MAG: hypothetical protein ACF8NJ_05050 [Phycisphaerales bacterium JB038]